MVQVEAEVSFLSTKGGGLEASQPNPTRSLLFHFGHRAPERGPLFFGAVLDVGQAEVRPGTESSRATLTFWADEEASGVAVPGAHFTIHYPPSRVIGEGHVLDSAR
jgi:hypothetical protein